MTNPDFIAARTRAIAYFGPEKYAQMTTDATAYFQREKLFIPAGGVEKSETFWNAIHTIMQED
jgi:hypothetical protein